MTQHLTEKSDRVQLRRAHAGGDHGAEAAGARPVRGPEGEGGGGPGQGPLRAARAPGPGAGRVAVSAGWAGAVRGPGAPVRRGRPARTGRRWARWSVRSSASSRLPGSEPGMTQRLVPW